MTAKQKSQLNELGFVWNVIEHQWDEAFNYLVAYKKEFGDCLVKQKTQYCNYQLGTWVTKQRSNKHNLISEQISRLDELGFVWKLK